MGSLKLFIGGISWETNEDGLREYFGKFGEVLEVIIMKDKNTGRSRGFGFIVFADGLMAETVVKQKHMIDGRNVEAKIAVPKEDQLSLNRSSESNHSSPSPASTKKIFVGGLASTVTESDFKKYFEQYGTITDVVVMYDLNTKRPRGFGFITFDSEEVVHIVLRNTFHELNGKTVEVKRAVPKNSSPGPNRSLVGNYGLNKVNNFVNAYSPGYNQTALGGYGMGMDERFSPLSIGLSGFLQYGSINYPMGPNLDSILSSDYVGNGNFQPNVGYGRGLSPLQNVYTNRLNTPSGFGSRMGVNGSLLNVSGRNMWSNGNNLHYDAIKPSHPNDFGGPRDLDTDFSGALGSLGEILGYSNSGQDGGAGSYSRTVNFGSGEDKFMTHEAIVKNNVSTMRGSSLCVLNDNRDEHIENLWQSFSSETVNSGGINHRHGIGNTPLDVTSSNSSGYVGGTSGSYRGIAA